MVRHALGIELLNSGRLDEAIEEFRHAIRLEPGFPYAYAAMGQALVLSKRRAEAKAALRRALELLPPADSNRSHVDESLEAADSMESEAVGAPTPAD